MRRAYGFAIVELLIVTVVIGILAVIAYATYRDGQERDMVTNRPQPPIGQYMKREDSQIRGGPLHYDNDGDVQAANCTG
ncbi:MAG: prepilin-type N-terminal cleavage/methylation domain-containing protein, partial [Bryobacterales bacterium]|nr:prepilin-type N-terminal cleavage/methylation domain-containing protein [Bryobacterales bacterium]